MSLASPPESPESTRSHFGLHELLCEQTRDLYDAALRFDGELAHLREVSVSPPLRDLVAEMSCEYREAAEDLARICALLGVPADGVACEAMKGLVREAKDSSSDWEDSATRDAAIIANAQRVAHYGIAGYGTGLAYARCLKEYDVARIFKNLLRRSVTLDSRLSKLAVGGWFSHGINDEAASLSHSQPDIEVAAGVRV